MTEVTLDDIKRAFPDWTIYRGTDRLWHARPATARPPVPIVTGEDLDDLSDEIRRHLAKAGEHSHRPEGSTF